MEDECFRAVTEKMLAEIIKTQGEAFELDVCVEIAWEMRFWPTGWVAMAAPIGPCARIGLHGVEDPWEFSDDNVTGAALAKHIVAGLCWVVNRASPKTARWEAFHPLDKGI